MGCMDPLGGFWVFRGGLRGTAGELSGELVSWVVSTEPQNGLSSSEHNDNRTSLFVPTSRLDVGL